MIRIRSAFSIGLWLMGCLSLSGCISTQKFVTVDAVSASEPSAQEPAYAIGVGDLLNIQVWDQDKMSAHVRVRADGRVSLPLLDDVEVVNQTPDHLARELEKSLKTVVVIPKVTVIVEESRPLSVSVLGEVARPGLQTLDRGAGLAQALAASGGITAFAHKSRIFVLRSGTQSARLRFGYEDITGAPGPARQFRLRTGDVVVVE
jgi:polysaccharide export outer membrane protein